MINIPQQKTVLHLKTGALTAAVAAMLASCTTEEQKPANDISSHEVIYTGDAQRDYQYMSNDSLTSEIIKEEMPGSDVYSYAPAEDSSLENQSMKSYFQQYQKITEPIAQYIDDHKAAAVKEEGFPLSTWKFVEDDVVLRVNDGITAAGYSVEKDGVIYSLSDHYGAVVTVDDEGNVLSINEIDYEDADEVNEFFQNVDAVMKPFK